MTERTDVATIRDWNRHDAAQTRHFAHLLAAYHYATEHEKRTHLPADPETHPHLPAEPYEKTGVDRHYVDETSESHTVRHAAEPKEESEQLPEAYRREVADPRAAFATAAVLLAHTAEGIAGCAVLAQVGDASLPTQVGAAVGIADAGVAGGTIMAGKSSHQALPPLELKRLWVEPAARGNGLAGELLHAAIERADATGAVLRLSVWNWRDGAIRLYERLGFVVVPSWDSRPDLLCLERSRP